MTSEQKESALVIDVAAPNRLRGVFRRCDQAHGVLAVKESRFERSPYGPASLGRAEQQNRTRLDTVDDAVKGESITLTSELGLPLKAITGHLTASCRCGWMRFFNSSVGHRTGGANGFPTGRRFPVRRRRASEHRETGGVSNCRFASAKPTQSRLKSALDQPEFARPLAQKFSFKSRSAKAGPHGRRNQGALSCLLPRT
jgi:hypothetical protein